MLQCYLPPNTSEHTPLLASDLVTDKKSQISLPTNVYHLRTTLHLTEPMMNNDFSGMRYLKYTPTIKTYLLFFSGFVS